MREQKSAKHRVPRHCIFLLLLCASPLTLAQTGDGEKGWEVNHGILVNLFNRSPLEMSADSSLGLLEDDALIPVFRSLTVTSPDIYGLRGAAAITHRLPDYRKFNKLIDRNYAMQLQARATYSSYFARGNLNFWLGALWKQQVVNSIIRGSQADSDSFGYNIGVDLNYADISISGSYYDGQAINDIYSNPYQALDIAGCLAGLCTTEGGNQGYVLKGYYAFTGATRFGISYGESSHYTLIKNTDAAGTELWTVGLYHDVNSWFKISAEYSNFKSLNYSFDEPSDMISIGGYIRW